MTDTIDRIRNHTIMNIPYRVYMRKDDLMRTEVYDIEGMSQTACSSAVERVTRKLEGVESSDVNLTTNKMTITYDETKVTPEMIMGR